MHALILNYRLSLDELLAAPQLRFDSALRAAVPAQPGIYRILKPQSDWRTSVYVGKSRDLRRRLYGDHFTGNRKSSTLKRKLIGNGLFVDEAGVERFLASECVVQFLVVQGGVERSFLEHFAIAILRPDHND